MIPHWRNSNYFRTRKTWKNRHGKLGRKFSSSVKCAKRSI